MIALPAFLAQRAKGEDPEAQADDPHRRDCAGEYHTDHVSYDATQADLLAIEPALDEARDLVVVGTDADVLA